jgi:copper transport protein
MTRRPIAIALVALTAAAAAAPAAHAHAVLVGTEPASRQLLQEGPHQVRLTFNERVSLALGGVQVFSPSGRLAGARATATDNRVETPVRTDERGTYAVSWRVLSADGDPVRGAFVFSVGRQTASQAAERAFDEAETNRPLAIAFGVVRFMGISGILLAVGGVVFAAVVASRARPRFVVAALVAMIAASVAGFFFEAAVAADVGLFDSFDPDIVDAQLSTIYGNAAVVRTLLAALGLVAFRLASPARCRDGLVGMSVAGVFVALALSQSITGHAMATAPTALRIPLDMVHVPSRRCGSAGSSSSTATWAGTASSRGRWPATPGSRSSRPSSWSPRAPSRRSPRARSR